MDMVLATKVARGFGLGEPTRPPIFVARGAMGEIWRLETSQGKFAAKVLFEWAQLDSSPPDLAIQRAAEQAGIPLPAPVTADDGSAVLSFGPIQARVYDWVELSSHPTLLSPGTTGEVGGLLGQLHALALRPTHPVEDWYEVPPGQVAWRQLVERARSAGLPWGDDLKKQMPRVDRLTGMTASAKSGVPIVCHRDFDTDNVLPRVDGRLIVLDWEDAGPLPPERELASVVLAWACPSGHPDQNLVAALFDGYWRAGGAARLTAVDDFSVAIIARLNFLKGMCEQSLDDPKHATYANAAVAGMLGSGLAELETSIIALN